MAWSPSYQLSCDGPGELGRGCDTFSDGGLDRKECAAWAGECGWLVTSRRHYCPECRRLKEGRVADVNQKAKLLLGRFVDAVVSLERRCPGAVKKPGAASRRVPDPIIQSLRTLADQAEDLLAEMRANNNE